MFLSYNPMLRWLEPRESIVQEKILDSIKRSCESFGYIPLGPMSRGRLAAALVGWENLDGNWNKLFFPLRRYAIESDFRIDQIGGGCCQQFIQADIDIIGDGELNILHDAEMVSVISGIFSLLAIGDFTIRISNRKLLQGLLMHFGIPEDNVKKALAIVDKLEKVGRANTIDSLCGIGLTEENAESMISILTEEKDTDDTLCFLRSQDIPGLFQEGLRELEEVIFGVRQLGVPEKSFCVGVSIARGLDYYTGTVYETRLDAYPDLGSIASGGRYDDLAGSFTNRHLPGVGISIGVTRLLLRLIRAEILKAKCSTVAKVMVTTSMSISEEPSLYLQQAKLLRSAGIATEIYLEDKPLGKQLHFAGKRYFQLAVITRAENKQDGTVVVRNLQTGDQRVVLQVDLLEAVQEMLDKIARRH